MVLLFDLSALDKLGGYACAQHFKDGPAVLDGVSDDLICPPVQEALDLRRHCTWWIGG